MNVDEILSAHGTKVENADEEVFELFSTYSNNADLGMLDPRAAEVDVSVDGKDFTIRQSSALLNSSLKGGTTGAVVWRISPGFASWLSARSNFLFRNSILTSESTVLELGAGISPLNALSLGPAVKRYVLTDQAYVLRLLRSNLKANTSKTAALAASQEDRSSKDSSKSTSTQGLRGRRKDIHQQNKRAPTVEDKIEVLELDWEVTDPTSVVAHLSSSADAPPATASTREGQVFNQIDVLVATDCIFNQAIIQPFVDTLAALSRPSELNADSRCRPALSIVAQQLRSPDVLTEWLEVSMEQFDIWRVSDQELAHFGNNGVGAAETFKAGSDGLSVSAGFVVYVCLLKERASRAWT